MSAPHQIGATQRPLDEIEDAEFVEIGEAPSEDSATASPMRSVLKFVLIAFAILFVGLAIIVIAAGPTSPPDEAEAQQMLAEWNRQVSGRVNDAGMILVDGSGEPGSECDLSIATQFVRFGGLTAAGTDGPLLHDGFKMGFVDQESTVDAFFWFDDLASTITIFDAGLFAADGRELRSVPDATIDVQPQGDGFLEFRGTRLHVCTVSE